MTCIKKIDWFRQLYHGGTKWKHSLTGQVEWAKMKVKDPNNGAKMTMSDLEGLLPNLLQDCCQSNLVPIYYQPEVNYFISTISTKQTFHTKTFSKLVQTRKDVLNFIACLEDFCKLSDPDQGMVVTKVGHGEIPLYTAVTNVLTQLQDNGISMGSEVIGGQGEETPSKFKMIDWLRHMYLMCQKWLNHEDGQVKWKVLNAKDPNNSKNGNRMKMEEVKESLQILVPNLEGDIVPKAYQSEVNIIQKVLCRNEGKFTKENLEKEEHLRKVAIKIEDSFCHLGDPDKLLSVVEPSKLPWVFAVVTCLKKHMEPTGQVLIQNEANAVIEYFPAHENMEESLDVDEVSKDTTDAELMQEQPSAPLDELENDDGTKYLLDIIDNLSQLEQDVPMSGGEVEENLAASPTESDISLLISEDSSSVSQRRCSDYFSDDSGFWSPESNNPLELEDPDILDEEDPSFIEDIIEELDYSTLPDVMESGEIKAESVCETHKRKRSDSVEGFEFPATKKAKP